MQINYDRTLTFEVSKSGKTVAWESGGAGTNTGSADIICAADGSKKTALFFRRGGSLSCGNHALFVLDTGDYIIHARQHRGDMSITVLKIGEIIQKDANSHRRVITANYNFREESWDTEPPKELEAAIKAAARKSRDYHCRSVYWGIEKPRRY
jgi:hypothetical protein